MTIVTSVSLPPPPDVFETYDVNSEHRCYGEVLQFFVGFISRYRMRHRDEKLLLHGDDEIALTTDAIAMRNTRVLWLQDVSITEAYLKGKRKTAPEMFRFRVTQAPETALPGGPNLRTPEELPADRIGPTLSQLLMGYAYERDARALQQKLPATGKKGKTPDLPRWPKDIQFFYHVRNACFHGGTFTIRENKIAAPDLPEWRGLVLPEDVTTINGRPILWSDERPDGLLRVPDVLPLLHDLGKAISRVL